MKRYLFIAIFVLIGLSQPVHAQNFKEEFKKEFDKKDFAKQEKILQSWEKADPNDAELYVSYFNFYVNKSRNEVVSLTKKPTSKDSIPLTKENDDKAVAYLGSRVSYEKKNLDAGISYIDKGIEKFPNRLDMRFGKIYILGQIEDYKSFTSEIVKTINYSNTNKNAWIWTDNKPLDEPKKFMLDAIQDYIVQMFNAGDEYANNIQTIAETVLKYYPDSVENLSNLAISFLIREDYENALVPLLKAEKLAPTDYIILNNIAWAYYSKGDKPNAVKYYNLVVKYGDDDAKAQANEKLSELKKND